MCRLNNVFANFRSQIHEILDTLWKINMEPKNHQIEKENHLNQLSFSGSILIFQVVNLVGPVGKLMSIHELFGFSHEILRSYMTSSSGRSKVEVVSTKQI